MIYDDKFAPHSHTYTRDGIIVPSCTRVLDWSGIVPVGPEGPRERARIRGSIVDEMIQESERGGDPEAAIPERCDTDILIEAEYRFQQWLRFRREVVIRKLRIQRWSIVDIDGYAYGVTPDIECEMEGKLAIIDVKCTCNDEKTHPLQTAAQTIAALHPRTFPDLWGQVKRFSLYLKKDGYRLKPHTDPGDFYTWRKLLAAHEEIRRVRGEKLWTPLSVRNATGPDSGITVG